MSRTTNDTDIDLSTECTDAFERLVNLAHATASVLTGDALSPEGMTQTPRSAALVMGMLTYLLRTDPNDLEALFFADGSLNQVPFRPGPPPAMRKAPLAFVV